MFNLSSSYQLIEPQKIAADKLIAGLLKNQNHQVLLGVTGSGKTFTIANVIAKTKLPTLVISHNKTLANQLYQEFSDFFPQAGVHYFISYYDYYQPEAYIPRSDTYIAKDAKINEQIEQMRYATTADILSRKDIIVVASVSCIYGISNPEEYQNISLVFLENQKIPRKQVIENLVELQYKRNDLAPLPGEFSAKGELIDIYLPQGENKIRVTLDAKQITQIEQIPLALGQESRIKKLEQIRIFPAKHYVTEKQKLGLAIKNIEAELKENLVLLKKENKLLEAERLEHRTKEDLAMMREVGYCAGIENYSRHIDFRNPGEPPFTLIDYFNHQYGKNNWLLVIDESHISLPQIRGMHSGDYSRKKVLVEYGFRLPSAIDNRPLKFSEFLERTEKTIYVSATPADYEKEKSGENNVIEQLIRPTGIIEPEIVIKPAKNQVKDLVQEIRNNIEKGEKTLAIVLTKKQSENLTEYFLEQEIKTHWLHSEIRALDRPELLTDLRLGNVDVIVGINLLREGLDLPEVSLIAILDADKEGFLRNQTSLLQIIGRASRHPKGKVILYADKLTRSIKDTLEETGRKRKIQLDYNKKHGLTPQPIIKPIRRSFAVENSLDLSDNANISTIVKALEKEMKKAAKDWDFEKAAKIKKQILKLTHNE